jgi:hypothetical protein
MVGSHIVGVRWQRIKAVDAPTSTAKVNWYGSSLGHARSTASIQHGIEKNRAASRATVQ